MKNQDAEFKQWLSDNFGGILEACRLATPCGEVYVALCEPCWLLLERDGPIKGQIDKTATHQKIKPEDMAAIVTSKKPLTPIILDEATRVPPGLWAAVQPMPREDE